MNSFKAVIIDKDATVAQGGTNAWIPQMDEDVYGVMYGQYPNCLQCYRRTEIR